MNTYHDAPSTRTSTFSLWALAGLLLLSGCDITDADDFDDGGNTDSWATAPFFFEVNISNQIRIGIVGVNGTVDIVGQDGATTVSIRGERRVGSDSVQDAKRHLDELEVQVTDLGDEVLVRTDQPRNTGGRDYVVDYTIALPSDLIVDVALVNGEITIDAIENTVRVDNVNGNVQLTNIVGNAHVTLVNGNIESDVVLPMNGEIDQSTTNGNIILSIPSATSADFSAAVTNGAISTSNLLLSNQVQTPRSLEGMLGSGEGDIALRTVNGAINVHGF